MLKLGRILTISVPKKHVCTLSSPNLILENLNERSVISVVGEEAPVYLQGLITNDINHLSRDCSSQYAMFLNSKGRVLYDSIIYRIDSKTYFVECDSSIAKTLEKHLKIYRLRRKVEVELLSDHQIHILFDKDRYKEVMSNRETVNSEKMFKFNLGIVDVNKNSNLKLFKDPRVSQLGYRVISSGSRDISTELSEVIKMSVDVESKTSYRKLRYSLGVGEGTRDLPPGNCFPLECNCDYLHGVSFHKGCYIGQELTARTYHTGVTRKRLMPVYFSESMKEMPSDDSITHEKVKLGRLRGITEDIGLALLRIDLVSSVQSFKIAGIDAVIRKPFWWPAESPKGKLSLKK